MDALTEQYYPGRTPGRCRIGVLVEFAGERVLFGGVGLAWLLFPGGFACGRRVRRVPEEVLADPLFADVEDGADLVEGGAEVAELVGGAFAASARGLAVEGGASLVQCVVSFGGRALCLFGLALCFGGGGCSAGWRLVVFGEPCAAGGGDAPEGGGPAASV